AALAGILDHALETGKLRIRGERACGQVKQPRTDDAAAPPCLGNVGEVEIEPFVGGQGFAVCVLQNIEAFGKGLHQAIFDSVVDHLDEMSGAVRAAMEVAVFGSRIAAVPPGGTWAVA